MPEDETGFSLETLKKRTTFPRSFSELVTGQLVPGNMAKSHALNTNLDVDYIIVFRYPASGESVLFTNRRICHWLI